MGLFGDLRRIAGREQAVSKLDSAPAPSLATVAVPKPRLGSEVNLDTVRIPAKDGIIGRRDSPLTVVPT